MNWWQMFGRVLFDVFLLHRSYWSRFAPMFGEDAVHQHIKLCFFFLTQVQEQPWRRERARLTTCPRRSWLVHMMRSVQLGGCLGQMFGDATPGHQLPVLTPVDWSLGIPLHLRYSTPKHLFRTGNWIGIYRQCLSHSHSKASIYTYIPLCRILW